MLGMGFSQQEATRALRFTMGDVEHAATFALEARQQAEERRKQDAEHRRKRKRQIKLGQTVGGHYVSIEALERLSTGGLGYPEPVALAALKEVCGGVCGGVHTRATKAISCAQTDNDVNAAVDLLSNADQFERIQLEVARRSDKGKRRERDREVDDAAVRGLQSMGFAAGAARQALAAAKGDQVVALDALVAMGEGARGVAPLVEDDAGGASGAGPSGTLGAGPSGVSELSELSASSQSDDGGLSASEDEVDQALVWELEGMVSRDPLEAYDVDVTQEGAVLVEYLGKCAAG